MARTAPRWLRSARRRPAAFLAILLLAAGAVLVSAVTPMLVDAVNAVSLRDGVQRASLPADGVTANAVAQLDDDLTDAQAAVDASLTAASSFADVWGTPQQVAEIEVVPRLFGPSGSPVTGRLALAPQNCNGMRITGTCPTSVSQGLLPTSVARTTGWRVGTVVTEKVPNVSGGDPAYLEIGQLTVVGVYDDTAGLGAVLADPTQLQTKAAPRSTYDLVVGEKDWQSFKAPVAVFGAIRVVKPVTQQDVAGLLHGIAVAQDTSLNGVGADVGEGITTRLDVLLQSIEAQQDAASVLAAPIGLEAVLLAWFALGAIAQRTARSRAAEWGVGRMRGARIRAWLGFVFTEPLVAIVLGAVLGYVLALLVSGLAALALFGTAQDVAPFTAAVFSGVGLATAGSLVALAAASARAAVLPLPQLLQDTAEPRQMTRVALVVQVALLSVAVAVIWAAVTTTSFGGQQLGLLLPAMLALVAGILAVHLTVVLVRRTSDRAPRALGGLIVLRGLARAPSVLVAGQLVLVSAALAACALQLGLLSAAVQTDRAQLATGASRVLTVQAPAGSSLLDLVRGADPGGRTAMAAEEIAGTPGQAGGKILAVDTARLAAVSTWAPQWRRGVDLTRLQSTGPVLTVTGTRLNLQASGVEATLQDPTSPNPPEVQLSLEIEHDRTWTEVFLGPLKNGRYRAAIPCSDGCRVIALQLHNAEGEAWTAQFEFASLSTDLQPASRLQEWLRADRWRNRIVEETDSTQPQKSSAGELRPGFEVTASDDSGTGTTQLEPVVGPAIVPVVSASDAALVRFPGVDSAVIGTSLAGTPILMDPVARVTAVPRSLRTGVIADLGTMLRAEDPALIGAEQQVWLAPTGQAGVLAALHREHVNVLGSERLSAAVADGLGSATNRALLVAGVTALIGVLFGLLALVATRVVDMGERRREWATLRLAGVPAGRLRRFALIQTAVPALVGAVVGVVVGALSASLIAARLPLIVGELPGPQPDLAVPVGPLALLALLLVLAVLGAAALVTAAEVRRSR